MFGLLSLRLNYTADGMQFHGPQMNAATHQAHHQCSIPARLRGFWDVLGKSCKFFRGLQTKTCAFQCFWPAFGQSRSKVWMEFLALRGDLGSRSVCVCLLSAEREIGQFQILEKKAITLHYQQAQTRKWKGILLVCCSTVLCFPRTTTHLHTHTYTLLD